jgi:signal transduction histidine kinase
MNACSFIGVPPLSHDEGEEVDRLRRRVAHLEGALARERSHTGLLAGALAGLHRVFGAIRGVAVYSRQEGLAPVLLGADADAIIGARSADGSLDREAWQAAVHPEDRDRCLAQWSAVARTGGTLIMEYRYRHPDTGAERWLREHVAVDRDQTIGFVIDVTREREQARRLREATEREGLAQRSKTDFLASVSHELRTPLNAIIGFAELIMTETFGPVGSERYIEYSRDIHMSGRHLKRLIDDILDVAKAESGRLELREALLDLDEQVAVSLRMVRDHAQRKNVDLSTEIDVHLPQLRADEGRLRQILLNLLSNAVKFTEDGGSVTVRATEGDDGGIVIAVADTGIGMAADDIPRALEPFVQIDSGLSRQYDGTGLGLPLVARLARLHGGQFALQSRPGVGTVASVLMPPARTVRPVLSADGADDEENDDGLGLTVALAAAS